MTTAIAPTPTTPLHIKDAALILETAMEVTDWPTARVEITHTPAPGVYSVHARHQQQPIEEAAQLLVTGWEVRDIVRMVNSSLRHSDHWARVHYIKEGTYSTAEINLR